MCVRYFAFNYNITWTQISCSSERSIVSPNFVVSTSAAYTASMLVFVVKERKKVNRNSERCKSRKKGQRCSEIEKWERYETKKKKKKKKKKDVRNGEWGRSPGDASPLSVVQVHRKTQGDYVMFAVKVSQTVPLAIVKLRLTRSAWIYQSGGEGDRLAWRGGVLRDKISRVACTGIRPDCLCLLPHQWRFLKRN